MKTIDSSGNWYNVGTAQFSPGAASSISMMFMNHIPYVSFRDNSVGDKVSVMRYNGSIWEFVGAQGVSIAGGA